MELNISLPLISNKDIETVNHELSTGQSLHFENFITDSYLDEFIEKPWGHEYRVYSDLFVDVWRLYLDKEQQTSMHCHPRKETVLICLNGHIEISFFNEKKQLSNGDIAFIPKGVFHSTENIGKKPAHIIEVETPRNKFDLIRKMDKYGRQGKGYETNYSKVEISPLRHTNDSTPNKIRDFDLNKQYAFQYLSGFTIKNNSYPDETLAVSLALDDIILQNIHITKSNDGRFTSLMNEKHYFIIEPKTITV